MFPFNYIEFIIEFDEIQNFFVYIYVDLSSFRSPYAIIKIFHDQRN